MSEQQLQQNVLPGCEHLTLMATLFVSPVICGRVRFVGKAYLIGGPTEYDMDCGYGLTVPSTGFLRYLARLSHRNMALACCPHCGIIYGKSVSGNYLTSTMLHSWNCILSEIPSPISTLYPYSHLLTDSRIWLTIADSATLRGKKK